MPSCRPIFGSLRHFVRGGKHDFGTAVFQAKFGKADQLVAAFKEMDSFLTEEQLQSLQPRILTDISGPFDTVVLETTHENLAALAEFRRAIFAMSETSEGQAATTGLIVSGRNEYYTIES